MKIEFQILFTSAIKVNRTSPQIELR